MMESKHTGISTVKFHKMATFHTTVCTSTCTQYSNSREVIMRRFTEYSLSMYFVSQYIYIDTPIFGWSSSRHLAKLVVDLKMHYSMLLKLSYMN